MDAMLEDSPEQDDAALDAELLQELLDWSGKGAADDMRARFGKPMPEDEAPMDAAAPAEDAEIPGVEAVPEGEGMEAGAAAGPDVEKLKRVLASLKG